MNHWALWGGIVMVLVTLWEAFETMILPRAVMRPGRVTHLFYRATHDLKRAVTARVRWKRLRETLLAAYGPLSLLMLVGLWATLVVVGFGLVHEGLQTPFRQTAGPLNLGQLVYFSGTTFFTLGFGDITPTGSLGRFLSVLEAGLGFGMLAAVMGYLPVLYQAFSNREAAIVRLANRCGGGIDGVGLVARYARNGNAEGLAATLEELEGWLSELLETTVSYPMLAFYRSQREDRSWIGGLTAVLDATTILQLPAETPWPPRLVDQAELTFSMAHRALDALVRALRQWPDISERRPHDFEALAARLERAGVRLGADAEAPFLDLTRRYEPEAACLAEFLTLDLPAWPIEA